MRFFIAADLHAEFYLLLITIQSDYDFRNILVF